MERLKYQVEKEELRNPVCIKTIHKDMVGGETRVKQEREGTAKYLNKLHYWFAVEERDSMIDVYVGEESLEDN